MPAGKDGIYFEEAYYMHTVVPGAVFGAVPCGKRHTRFYKPHGGFVRHTSADGEQQNDGSHTSHMRGIGNGCSVGR